MMTNTPAPAAAATIEATTNPCRLCAPLGAALVFKGTEGAITLLHGSQGCATYIRRYLISHFREPVDIASSSFSEESVIFGGGANLRQAIKNVITRYNPSLIGIASTCLSETIGDDPAQHLDTPHPANPLIVTVSTASYRGCHTDGYRAAVKALLCAVVKPALTRHSGIALVPGILSPADIRYVKEILAGMDISYTVAADYSDTLDGGSWEGYQPLPPGGTPLAAIQTLSANAVVFDWSGGSAEILGERFGIPLIATPPPLGIEATDQWIAALTKSGGGRLPGNHAAERLRLIDAYVDGHKYLSGKRVFIYAEAPLAAGLARFCLEIGIIPALVACPEAPAMLAGMLDAVTPLDGQTAVAGDLDFDRLQILLQDIPCDLVIGNSKCAAIARSFNIPHVRVGFPVHDRFGASRLMHVGYRGAQQLFDRIVNAMLAAKQDSNDIGYSYL
jgi:nitrogenase molybdenum-iron protein NifN